MFIFFIVAFVLLLAGIVGIIANVSEQKYKQNLLIDESFLKFKKLHISRMEVQRFLKTAYFGRNNAPKRKKIPLDSPLKDSIFLFYAHENELCVFAYENERAHEVFCCPYSKDNKEKLQAFVDKYNDSKPKQQ